MANKKRLIDAEKAYEIARDSGCHNDFAMSLADLTSLREVLEDCPTVDAVEVVHGEWIHCQGKSNLWYCSACGEKVLYNPTRRTYNIAKRPVHEVNKYCRCCGAKMDGDRNG